MENLNNYINESLSKKTIKQLEVIFSELTKEATDENWDILLKQKLSDVTGYMKDIETYLKNKRIEKYFDSFKKCLKKSQDINNGKLTRKLFVDYINGEKLKLENLISNNEPMAQGNIYKKILGLVPEFSLSYLKDIYNISGQDDKALGVGKGEVLLICFLEGAMKGNGGDVQIGENLIEVKGNRARIPFNNEWFDKFLSNFEKDENSIENFDKYLTGITNFKKLFKSSEDKEKLLANLEKIMNEDGKNEEDWSNFNIKILGDREISIENTWRLIAALSLMHYDAPWSYFCIMNEQGYYKILKRSNKVINYYEFLEGIKLDAGLVKGAQSHKGFQFTLL